MTSKVESINKSKKPPFIIYLVLFASAVSFIALGYNDMSKNLEAHKWPIVKGTIIKSYILKSDPSGIINNPIDKDYYPNVIYKYTIDNKEYENSKIYYGTYQASESNARKIVEKYPDGSSVNIHYKPDSPQESVLEIAWTFKSFLLMICGVIFAGLFILVVYQGIVLKKQDRLS